MANRVLALDVGTKRIGIAVSDPLYMFARGLDTISRKPDDKSISIIKDICNQNNIIRIVVGLPFNMDGTEGSQVDDVKEFVSLLQKEIDLEFVYQDERLTSSVAEDILREQGIQPSKNKELVDKKAAEIILQDYMSSNKL